MKDLILNLAVLAGILGASAVFTEWFTRKMYYRCRGCLTLNAKRRAVCRHCGGPLP
jgi:rRNA maturation endonuclease Nob1